MRSEAKTVEAYLDELSDDRRASIEAVRSTILDSLPEGFEEVMNWGMITYQVPLDVYPDTYNGQPLMLAALASQKNHMAVYLSGIYANEGARERFEEEYRATGKRYDVGKSCVRFRRLEDLPLDVIERAVQAIPMSEFIETYESGRNARRAKGS
ncbi:MAG: DUF1801 domain-containing protein [Gemmatimonadota bacterium]